jgi:hypothetical protein
MRKKLEVEAAARAIFEYMEDRPWSAASPLEIEFFKSAALKAIRSGESLSDSA